MNRKKLLYSILKEIQNGQIPKQLEYELSLNEWGEIALLMKDEDYAKGIAVSKGDNVVAEVSFSSARVTMKGLDFLEENNAWTKVYKTAKEARDWFKI